MHNNKTATFYLSFTKCLKKTESDFRMAYVSDEPYFTCQTESDFRMAYVSEDTYFKMAYMSN